MLATNVAETSLTVPGVRYVIDTGLARVKRYSYRNKVEQLQVEPISQAAANQRAGRCGRVADGDLHPAIQPKTTSKRRSRFTDPGGAAVFAWPAVILRMKSLGLGDVREFPFVEPPPARAIADGYQLLAELNAVDARNELTPIGREIANLPLDPRVGRMLLAAREQQCLREMLVIAAALSVQDPRERPLEAQDAADNAHRRFADDKSDFLSLVKLWAFVQERIDHKKSNRKLTDELKSQFLSPRRVREWIDVHTQLATIASEHGWRVNASAATFEQIHRCAAGRPAGQYRHSYRGCRARRAAVRGRAWHQVLHLARLGAAEESRAMDRRCRAWLKRIAPVCADCRDDRDRIGSSASARIC